MNSGIQFLKMKTPADMLAIHFLATSGQLKGSFVQEVEPPWTIWWRSVNAEKGIIGKIGSLLRGDINAPETVWESGSPGGSLKDITWLDLFRKAVIKKQETKKISDEIISLTPDRELFFKLIKEHFVLQQGKIEIAIYEPGEKYYLIKIENPSLWVLNRVEKDRHWTWFNKIEGQSGLLVEAGSYIHDISGTEIFNQFHLTQGSVLLVQRDGRLLTLRPKWKKGESLIRVDCPEPGIPEADETEKIEVTPRLREIDDRRLATLWKIEDQSRLKAIFANESLNRFKGYKAWFSKTGTIWVMAREEHLDRGLASIFCDAFPSFYEMTERVFVPIGKVLTPCLSSERFQQIFESRSLDWVCVEDSDSGIKSTILGGDYLKPIESFISLCAEKADKLAEVESVWAFEFPELKKKKLIIEIEVDEKEFKRFEATSEAGQVGSAGKSRRNKNQKVFKFDLSNLPNYGESELSDFRLQLSEIDARLMENIGNANLWNTRATVCYQMKLKNSAYASITTYAIINNDLSLLASTTLGFIEDNPKFKAILEDEITELEKGKLLSAIRKSKTTSEFYYLILLAFAARFDDEDIYWQAVESMKSGFANEDRDFHNFNDTRVAGSIGLNTQNKVELLKESDFPRIQINVNKLIQQMCCCSDYKTVAVMRMQLHAMLKYHLSEETANRAVRVISIAPLENYRYDNVSTFYNFFFERIEAWPESLKKEDPNSSVGRWLRLMMMDKISETPLKEFFTGDLYKAPFKFYRDRGRAGSADLMRVPWMKTLTYNEFPEESDGKPIARAIYSRFAAGYNDWDAYFKFSLSDMTNYMTVAWGQRLLLLMVSEFGPHKDFEKYIMPVNIEDGHKGFFELMMYCDMFRLCLAYKKPVDEQRLFNNLIRSIPHTSKGVEDLKAAAEWIIMSLLLTSSPVRRFQLDNLASRFVNFLQGEAGYKDYEGFAEGLTIMSFFGIGTLADLVPEKLEYHQLLERRRVLWLEHAFATAAEGEKGWQKWKEACAF